MKIKKALSLALIASLTWELVAPATEVIAADNNFPRQTLISRGGGGGRGGGARGGGGGARANRGGGGFNRSEFGGNSSGRINRDRVSRPAGERRVNSGNMNLNRDLAGSNRINRERVGNRPGNINRERVGNRPDNINRERLGNRPDNINRERLGNRPGNIDRNRVQNNMNRRDLDLNADRNFSNRVNRNLVNINRNNIVVNPRGWGAWGWNGGVAWAPNYGYWGGGFWGPFAAGVLATGLTTAVISAATANNEPNYVVIDSSSPGYSLFSNYGLMQIACTDDENIVVIYGPQESVMCASPNNNVPAGVYDVNPSDLTLVLR